MDDKKVYPLYCEGKLKVYVTMEVIKQIESVKESVKKKIFNRVKLLGDHGYIKNTEQFRKIEGSGVITSGKSNWSVTACAILSITITISGIKL
jgi:hypothetical protein